MLEERDGSSTTTMTYTLGLTVITQGDDAGTPNVYHLMHDGHGSTRALLDESTPTIAASYAYDAYGNAEGFTPGSAATRHLYTGEQYDAHLSFYYRRARWYDQSTGRFNRMDPFAGNSSDPQSLHKYLYAHANPVMRVDPSGEMSLIELVSTIGEQAYLQGSKIFTGVAIRRGLYNALANFVIQGTIRWLRGEDFFATSVACLAKYANVGVIGQLEGNISQRVLEMQFNVARVRQDASDAQKAVNKANASPEPCSEYHIKINSNIPKSIRSTANNMQKALNYITKPLFFLIGLYSMKKPAWYTVRHSPHGVVLWIELVLVGSGVALGETIGASKDFWQWSTCSVVIPFSLLWIILIATTTYIIRSLQKRGTGA